MRLQVLYDRVPYNMYISDYQKRFLYDGTQLRAFRGSFTLQTLSQYLQRFPFLQLITVRPSIFHETNSKQQ